jgi:hypothetical protein
MHAYASRAKLVRYRHWQKGRAVVHGGPSSFLKAHNVNILLTCTSTTNVLQNSTNQENPAAGAQQAAVVACWVLARVAAVGVCARRRHRTADGESVCLAVVPPNYHHLAPSEQRSGISTESRRHVPALHLRPPLLCLLWTHEAVKTSAGRIDAAQPRRAAAAAAAPVPEILVRQAQ